MKASKRDFWQFRQYPQLIKKFFSNEDWQSFQHVNEIPKEKSERMYDFIAIKIQGINQKEEKRNDLRLKLLSAGRYLAAAAVTMFIGLALWMAAPENAVKPKHLTVPPELQTVKLNVIWKEIRNAENNILRVQFPDSSIAYLSPHSALKYEEGFQKKFRAVFLIGKAQFQVKKDPERPFSVHAGGLKTTALGTSFTINTTALKLRTSVILHTGKIVVRSNSNTGQSIYISKAGAGLIYDQARQTTELIKSPAERKPVMVTSFQREGTAMIMKNIPMPKVIALLNEAYHVNITVVGKDIGHITYTGTVDSSKEQIGQVLNVICLINGMDYIQNSEQDFIIQKSIKQTQ